MCYFYINFFFFLLFPNILPNWNECKWVQYAEIGSFFIAYSLNVVRNEDVYIFLLSDNKNDL